jgi:putative restriction endonuclease
MEINLLKRALIEKFGNDYGFEVVLASTPQSVNLASARHRTKLSIETPNGLDQFRVLAISESQSLLSELDRSFPNVKRQGANFLLASDKELSSWLRRAAELSHSLPSQAADEFETRMAEEIANLPATEASNTEVLRLVRQRVGQQTYRQVMLEYWGGACAVTGLSLAPVLRASHAKPWADCDNDAERLDVFNGFLLSANLDALFDRFLISFDSTGELMVSSTIPKESLVHLGLIHSMRLRWIALEHHRYLQFHRSNFIS